MNRELLEKLENDFYVHHVHAMDVEIEILRYIQYGRKEECKCIVGPAGVGKSRMIRRIASVVSKRLDDGWRPGYGHPIIIEAPSQFKKDFPWRSFLQDILRALGEMDDIKKVDLDLAEERKRMGTRSLTINKIPIHQLEKQIRLRIEVLKPAAILIDEAQNIVEGLSLSNRRENVNRLKYWANTMNTKFLLFGTHECKDILNLNEQLSRRISAIHFPRYAKNKLEIREFGAFYKSLINGLDISISKKVGENFLYVYNHSLGCPGLLSTWLQSCIAYCIDANLPTISWETFKKHRFTKDRLLVMETAIKTFEIQYQASLEEFNPDTVQVEMVPFQKSLVYTAEPEKPQAEKNIRPGQQKPKRHPVCED